MTEPAPGDQAKVTVTVAVPPAEASRIFTEEIELWWRARPQGRATGEVTTWSRRCACMRSSVMTPETHSPHRSRSDQSVAKPASSTNTRAS